MIKANYELREKLHPFRQVRGNNNNTAFGQESHEENSNYGQSMQIKNLCLCKTTQNKGVIAIDWLDSENNYMKNLIHFNHISSKTEGSV